MSINEYRISKFSGIILFIIICWIGILNPTKGQAQVLSDSDYSVYNYLIHRTLVEDTSLIYYEARFNDTTDIGPYLYDLRDTGTYISSHDYVSFAMLKRPKCYVDKSRLSAWKPKKIHKLAEFQHVSYEFSKCYFFNNGNSVILYFGVHVYLGGAGYVEILERNGNSWKVVKKRLQWVG